MPFYLPRDRLATNLTEIRFNSEFHDLFHPLPEQVPHRRDQIPIAKSEESGTKLRLPLPLQKQLPHLLIEGCPT